MRPKILPLVHLNFSAPLIFIRQMDIIYPNTLSGPRGGGGVRVRDKTASSLKKKNEISIQTYSHRNHTPFVHNKLSSKTQ